MFDSGRKITAYIHDLVNKYSQNCTLSFKPWVKDLYHRKLKRGFLQSVYIIPVIMPKKKCGLFQRIDMA